MVSGRRINGKIAYTSEDEAESTRERCIRVAAIVIVTTAGIWKVCWGVRNEEPLLIENGTVTMLSRSGIRGGNKSFIFIVGGQEREGVTVQIKSKQNLE